MNQNKTAAVLWLTRTLSGSLYLFTIFAFLLSGVARGQELDWQDAPFPDANALMDLQDAPFLEVNALMDWQDVPSPDANVLMVSQDAPSPDASPSIDESDVRRSPAFGGSDSPDVLLEDKESPLKLGGYYITVYQWVSESLTENDDALGGKLRLTGTWTPYGRESGNFGRLAVTLDRRHKFTNIASTELAEQIGYLGQTQVVLSDAGFSVVHLNWAQAFRGGDAGVIIGRIDPNDYFAELTHRH